MPTITLTRDKKYLSGVNYDMFSVRGFRVKFSTKLVVEDYNGHPVPYYHEYVYKGKSGRDVSISVKPRGTIVLDFRDNTMEVQDKLSMQVYMKEVDRNLYVKQLRDFTDIISAHVIGKLDIIDTSGRVRREVSSKVKLHYEYPIYNNTIIKTGIGMLDGGIVGVHVSANEFTTELHFKDYLAFIYALEGIDYNGMIMTTISAVGLPEFGEEGHRTDLRHNPSAKYISTPTDEDMERANSIDKIIGSVHNSTSLNDLAPAPPVDKDKKNNNQNRPKWSTQ